MIAYITGTSSGIGKSLALKFLKEGHQVVGISRTCTIKENGYVHHFIDLSNTNEIINFDFESNTTDDIILINNAGIIGPIKPFGHHIEKEIIDLNTINIIAPQLLTNKFINKFLHLSQNYQIINISSGAGKSPIDAWSTYCASKSAIDLFSETISQELKERKHFNWSVYSIAPGVVDTQMQINIRNSNPNSFLNHQKFIDLHKNKELVNPTKTANLLFKIIIKSIKTDKTVFSLRDIS